MKRIILSCLIMLLCLNAFATQPLIDIVRSSFGIASSNKSVCFEMIAQLERSEKTPLEVAYLGAYQTIRANHIASPFDKLKTFRTGKKNIESAVQSEPENVEIRFIRLSIQHKAPGILGYQSNQKEDLKFILEHRDKVKDKIINDYIDQLLKEMQ